MKEKDYSKGEFQHNIFKFIILIFIGIFIFLIFGYIYVTFFSAKSKDISNKFKNIKQIDEFLFKKYNKIIPYCEIDYFYINQISKRLPCVYKYNNQSTSQYNIYIQTIEKHLNETISVKDIGFVYFLDKFMKFFQFDIINKNSNYFDLPKADNFGKVFINLNQEKIKFGLSPLSQFNELNAYINETYKDFNTYNSKYEIIDSNINDLISFEYELEKGDLLYVPSFYFIQIKNINKNLLIYQYKDSNKIQECTFKSLFSYKQ